MNLEKIKNEYQRKIKEIIKHNKSYYDKSNPEISDEKLDAPLNILLMLFTLDIFQ